MLKKQFRWRCVPYLLLVSLVSAFPALTAEKTKSATTVSVTVENVRQSYFYDIVQEVGKIKAIDSADLSFIASNKITKIHFKNGDKVKKGDVIAEIDNTEAQADLDKARSSLALAKTKLERTTELLKREPYALSKQALDEVKENVDAAKADFHQKLAAMKDYLIIAPFNGQLTSFNRSVGSLIGSDTVLVTLYKLDPVEVYYAISQKDFGKAHKGQRVSVTVEAYKDRVFYGQVNYVAPAVDEQSGRVTVRAELENPHYALAPGMFANIKHYLGHRLNHLLVPQNSVVANNEQRFVWLVRGNQVKKQMVTLGNNVNNGYVVIKDGVTKDDIVIKTGMQNLKPNSTIHILPSDKTILEQSSQEAK
ncbi:MAG: efflux RND transporter periplasmic adaptor subunit [Parashewanella sp.]